VEEEKVREKERDTERYICREKAKEILRCGEKERE
jgi:hypothetical protein